MGVLQRIFYFHAAAAWAGETAFSVCFLANLLYVWKRQPKYDWLGVTCAEVGAGVHHHGADHRTDLGQARVGNLLDLGRAADFDICVVAAVHLAILLLRTLIEEPDRRALLSALFGIFAFIDVPIVFGAIRWWRTQHPAPVIMGGPNSGLDPTMRKSFFLQCAGDARACGLFDRGAVFAGKNEARRGNPATGSGGAVKNLNSVFAAYMIGWGVFFLFFVSIVKRSSDLRAEVERLKKTAPRESPGEMAAREEARRSRAVSVGRAGLARRRRAVSA